MSKDKYSVHWDGSEEMDGDEGQVMPARQRKEPSGLPDHILDNHHDTLMKAQAIHNNPHIMKHLQPHMEKKMADLKIAMNAKPGGSASEMPEHESPKGKITSIKGLKEKAKSMK